MFVSVCVCFFTATMLLCRSCPLISVCVCVYVYMHVCSPCLCMCVCVSLYSDHAFVRVTSTEKCLVFLFMVIMLLYRSC